jgi:hypothetical protein
MAVSAWQIILTQSVPDQKSTKNKHKTSAHSCLLGVRNASWPKLRLDLVNVIKRSGRRKPPFMRGEATSSVLPVGFSTDECCFTMQKCN